MCDPKPGGMKDGEAYYLQIRDQIKHEDNLCNNRMTWLISLQSFLFGAYGFTANISPSNTSIETARSAFCTVGIISASAIALSLMASRQSSNKLVDRWFASIYYSDAFPPIIGTYSKIKRRGTRLGYYPLLIIPSGCIIAWILILLSLYGINLVPSTSRIVCV